MSELFTFLTGRAGSAFDGRAQRVLPVTVGSSLIAAALLAGWLVAIALLLTSTVWVIGGAITWALVPLAAGVALCVVLARIGGRSTRRRARSKRSDDNSVM